MWLEIKTSKVVAVCAAGGAVAGFVMFDTITPLSILGPAGLVGGIGLVAIRHLKEREQAEKDRLAREAFRARAEAMKTSATKVAKDVAKEVVGVPTEVVQVGVEAAKTGAKVGAQIGSTIVGGAVGVVMGATSKVRELFKRDKDEPEDKSDAG